MDILLFWCWLWTPPSLNVLCTRASKPVGYWDPFLWGRIKTKPDPKRIKKWFEPVFPTGASQEQALQVGQPGVVRGLWAAPALAGATIPGQSQHLGWKIESMKQQEPESKRCTGSRASFQIEMCLLGIVHQLGELLFPFLQLWINF